ncbi:MAG: hypothetical protein AAF762_07600 [Pseudomonadota bacterium]
MIFEMGRCEETVSFLWAMIFGAGEACVDMGVTSLVTAIVAFMVAVAALRFVGSWVIRRAFSAPSARELPPLPDTPPLAKMPPPADPPRRKPGSQVKPDDGPIKSTGAWGGERH